MKTCEPNDAYARRVAVAIARCIGETALVCGVVLGLGWLVYDCGNVADANPTPAEAAPEPPAPAPPDAEVLDLHERLQNWQPLWRERTPGELLAVATTIVTACRRDGWPTRARCPYLLAALAFRESSFRHDAIGARGERGLMQLMPGAALAGETRESAMDLDVNVRLALAWLRTAEGTCRRAGWGSRADFTERVLGAYAGLGCARSGGARMVERWATEIAEVTP